jgi:glycosyltransferase involved in cell wall biosynthesis
MSDRDHITVTLIIPVRNERASIDRLIHSIESQTRLPDEVIFVDGDSEDGTADCIAARAKSSPVDIRLIRSRQPLFPGAGRNLGVVHAKHPWIAFTDAGIELRVSWLSALIEAVGGDPDIDVVYGDYEPRCETRFSFAAAIAYVTPPAMETPRCRPPFVASMLIRRSAFERTHGFLEQLRSAEDLLFIRRIYQLGLRTTRAPRARVLWELPAGIRPVFRRFRTYATSNLRAGLGAEWHEPVLDRYLVCAGIGLTISLVDTFIAGMWAAVALGHGLLGARALRAIWRNRKIYPSSSLEWGIRWIFIVAILGVIDLAMMAGSFLWLLDGANQVHPNAEGISAR